MKILGIDFGLTKIGLAIADDILAQPLKVIKNNQRTLTEIIRIVEEEKIEMIIVGVSQGKMGKKARSYGRRLEKAVGLKVAFQDETLTTKEAIVKMIEAGKGKKYRQEKEDAFAAAIILQSFLDRN